MMRPRILHLSTILALTALSSSCKRAAPAATGITSTTDTVGGVVEVHLTGTPKSLHLQPTLAVGTSSLLGTEPSPDEFGKVVGVIADDAGNVFVADALAHAIQVFGPDGRYLRTLGRKGQGPGELEGLHAIAWLAGDTLVAMDNGNARLTLLDEDGRYVGQWQWLRYTGDTRFLFNGGPREIYARTFARAAEGSGRSLSVWARYTPEGPRDSVPVPMAPNKPGTLEVCRGSDAQGIGFEGNPWGNQLKTAPAPDRERIVAWTASYRLAFLDPAGDTVRVISRDVEPQPLSDSAWAPMEKEYAKFRKDWHDTDCEGSIIRPENRPVLRDIVLDHQGRVLVEHTTADGMAFDVLDPDGRWVETFPSPPDRDTSVPPFLRGDRLYLVTRDSLDVQRVRGFRIQTDGS